MDDLHSPKFVGLLISGICGSIVGLTINPTLDTPTRKVLFIFGGVCCTFFLAGPIADYLHLKDPGEIASLGFVISIFWQKVLIKISDIIDKFKVEVPKQ